MAMATAARALAHVHRPPQRRWPPPSTSIPLVHHTDQASQYPVCTSSARQTKARARRTLQPVARARPVGDNGCCASLVRQLSRFCPTSGSRYHSGRCGHAGSRPPAPAHLRPPTCTSATASRGLPATTHPLPRPYHRSWVSRQHLKGPNARGAQQIWPPGRHHQLQLAQAQPVVLSFEDRFPLLPTC